MRVEPFEVAIPQASLDDLHRRLDATRRPDVPAGATGPEGPWQFGTDDAFLHDLAAWLERSRAPKRGGKRGRGAAP